VTAFAVGGAMAYFGLSPLFSSDRFTPPDASRLDLVAGAAYKLNAVDPQRLKAPGFNY
jgi:hypothetical protein